jgi:hypothetical protein
MFLRDHRDTILFPHLPCAEVWKLKQNIFQKVKFRRVVACGRAVDQRFVAAWNMRPLLYKISIAACGEHHVPKNAISFQTAHASQAWLACFSPGDASYEYPSSGLTPSSILTFPELYFSIHRRHHICRLGILCFPK